MENKRIGMVLGLPAAEYHSGPEVSNTGLGWYIDYSPLHYWRYVRGKIKRSTKSMDFGTNLHCLLLEPSRFALEYAKGPDCRRGSKEWIAALDYYPGKKLLKPDEFATISEAREAIRESGDKQRWLIDTPGKTEVSFFWTDQATELSCRCRTDKLIDLADVAVAVDVKSCRDARPHKFRRSMLDYGYYRQAAFYTDGVSMVLGKPVIFIDLAVESTTLIAVAYAPGGDRLEEARAQISGALEGIKTCQATGIWPGYSDDIEEI